MSDTVNLILRQRLNEALLASPHSLKEVARRAGYGAEYISALAGRAARRRHNPTISAVWAIAAALDIDPLWLLGR